MLHLAKGHLCSISSVTTRLLVNRVPYYRVISVQEELVHWKTAIIHLKGNMGKRTEWIADRKIDCNHCPSLIFFFCTSHYQPFLLIQLHAYLARSERLKTYSYILGISNWTPSTWSTKATLFSQHVNNWLLRQMYDVHVGLLRRARSDLSCMLYTLCTIQIHNPWTPKHITQYITSKPG